MDFSGGHIRAFYNFMCHAYLTVTIVYKYCYHDNGYTCLYPLVCNGYLRLYELHEDNPQYLLPNEEYTYECVNACDQPDVVKEEEGICEGKDYTQGCALNGVFSVWSRKVC